MPGPGAQDINSLIDLMQPQRAAVAPAALGNFFTGEAGGGPGGMGAPGVGMGTGGLPAAFAGGMPTSAFAAANMARPGRGWSPLNYTRPDFNPDEAAAASPGFFRLSDLYASSGAQTGAPMGPRGPGVPATQTIPGAVPDIFQRGAGDLSTDNWQLLGRGPGWIMRNGQLINAMTPQARQGLPWGADPSFSDTAESGVANFPRTVAPGGALTGRNIYDAYYWPGGDIMGRTRWPYGTNV